MKDLTAVLAAWTLALVGELPASGQELPPELAPFVPQAAVPQGGKGEEEPAGTSEVAVSDFMMVDIVSQADLVTNVLQKIAIQARRNIVPSAAAERRVNATIYGVPFYDALTGLLEPNGLGYVERGEFLYVYTFGELAALQVAGWGPITRVIHLDYMRAADARDFVSKMLSPDGHIEVTRDLSLEGDAGGAAAVPAEAGAGGAEAVAQASGGGSEGSEIYTPEVDQFDVRNAIVVHDYPSNVDRIEEFLREVDVRPAQVLLEATIIQTTLSEANAFGVDFALFNGQDFLDYFITPVVDVPPFGVDNQGQPIGFQTAQPSGKGGFGISGAGDTGTGDATLRAGYVGDVGIFIRALDRVTDVTLLSNPKILALNRQRARVFVGTKVGYLETVTVENQVLQTIKFLDTGIVLDIRPYVLRDQRVRLELSPKVSQASFRGEIPDELVQNVTTDVLVPEGYTAVIGGLFREDTSRNRAQVPVVGDLPIVGPLFRGVDDSVQQVEIIFLIKPTVMREKALVQQGRRALELGEQVRVGSRFGLLPWSRDRHSARLNLAAERDLEKGNERAAAWHVRRSLAVDPLQPEIVEHYERLGGKPVLWQRHSYLDQIIDEELARTLPEVPPAPEPGETEDELE